ITLLLLFFFFLQLRPPPLFTLFPYTTLFRSVVMTMIIQIPIVNTFNFVKGHVEKMGVMGLLVLQDNVAQDLREVLVLQDQWGLRSEERTSELQSPCNLVCRLLLEKKNGTECV